MSEPQSFVSVSRRPPDVEDYIDILRRYRSWVIAPTFAGLVLSVVIACYLPDVYVCKASLQIKPSTISSDLLPTAISVRMAQRLQQLQVEIRSRDNLIQLITSPTLDLYKKERARLPVEDVAEEYFQRNLHIVPLASVDGESRGAAAFQISFQYPDRVKSQKVVAQLITMFQNKNQQYQASQANSQTTLLDDLLHSSREKMEKASADLAEFSAQNQGKLPENVQSNMLEVQNRSNQLLALSQQIDQEKSHAALLEVNISNILATEGKIQVSVPQVQTTANPVVTNSNLINMQSAITTKTAECAGKEQMYQPGFVDVVKCKEELKALEDQRARLEAKEGGISGGGSTSKTVSVTDPRAVAELDSLRNQEISLRNDLQTTKMSIESKEREEQQITRLLKEAQEKVTASPAIMQRFSTLTQALDMARAEYEKMSKTKEVSNTTQSMEDHGAGETLEILENPITPETPASPVRGAIIGVGAVVGLFVGFALAGLKEIKNTSLKNLKDVRAYTNLPVLSSIPLLENALLVRRKRRLAWLAWSTAVIVGGFLMCGAVYYHLVIAGQVS